jgi:hypothetical protein
MPRKRTRVLLRAAQIASGQGSLDRRFILNAEAKTSGPRNFANLSHSTVQEFESLWQAAQHRQFETRSTGRYIDNAAFNRRTVACEKNFPRPCAKALRLHPAASSFVRHFHTYVRATIAHCVKLKTSDLPNSAAPPTRAKLDAAGACRPPIRTGRRSPHDSARRPRTCAVDLIEWTEPS